MVPKVYGKQDLTYQEALTSEDGELWKTVIEDEYKSLMKNGTWETVPLPPNREPLSNRWVLEIKAGYGDIPERYKVRLVGKGYTQKFGEDYTDTYAPVLKLPAPAAKQIPVYTSASKGRRSPSSAFLWTKALSAVTTKVHSKTSSSTPRKNLKSASFQRSDFLVFKSPETKANRS